MLERPTLEAKVAEFANFLRAGGIGLIGLAFVIFLFTPHIPLFPLNAVTWSLVAVFAVGMTMFLIGRSLMRKIVGFGTMEPTPITVTLFKR